MHAVLLTQDSMLERWTLQSSNWQCCACCLSPQEDFPGLLLPCLCMLCCIVNKMQPSGHATDLKAQAPTRPCHACYACHGRCVIPDRGIASLAGPSVWHALLHCASNAHNRACHVSRNSSPNTTMLRIHSMHCVVPGRAIIRQLLHQCSACFSAPCRGCSQVPCDVHSMHSMVFWLELRSLGQNLLPPDPNSSTRKTILCML